MSNLEDLPRAELVQRAKRAGVKASGKNDELIAAIRQVEAATVAAEGEGSVPAEADAKTDLAEQVADAEARAAEAEADAKAAAKAQKAFESGKGLPIVRQDDFTWWCPVDDFSQPQGHESCGRCGALRHGDHVEAR